MYICIYAGPEGQSSGGLISLSTSLTTLPKPAKGSRDKAYSLGQTMCPDATRRSPTLECLPKLYCRSSQAVRSLFDGGCTPCATFPSL